MDDIAVDTRRGREQFASTTLWPRPASLDDVVRAVSGQAGVGRSAFLHVRRSNQIGHAIVLHRAERGLWVLDPANSDSRMAEVSDAAGLRGRVDGAVSVRALVTDPSGTVISNAFQDAVQSSSSAQALTDPADTRLGAPRGGRASKGGFTLGKVLRGIDPGRSDRRSGIPATYQGGAEQAGPSQPAERTGRSRRARRDDESLPGDDEGMSGVGEGMSGVGEGDGAPSDVDMEPLLSGAGGAADEQAPGPPPADVVGWRPDGSTEGSGSFKEFLLREKRLSSESLTSGGRGQLSLGVREWVRQWVVGLRGQADPSTRRRYAAWEVAVLSGGLVGQSTVSKWWRDAAGEQPLVAPE
ncbi:MAG: hypothetical protein ACRDYV_19970, partial [Acidimicrobiia bacterium]